MCGEGSMMVYQKNCPCDGVTDWGLQIALSEGVRWVKTGGAI